MAWHRYFEADGIPDDCVLTKDLERDCCGHEPLKLCRIFSGFSAFLVLVSLSISLFLFSRQFLRTTKSSFNFYMHILINLTLLCKFSILFTTI